MEVEESKEEIWYEALDNISPKDMETHKPEVLSEKTCRKQCIKIRDVILACEEKQTKAHKIVQSAFHSVV